MKILITGGAGFIGSHLVRRWNAARPDDLLLNVDKLGYAADRSFESELLRPDSYRFEQLDLADGKRLRELVMDFAPDGIVHLAAESHVDNSIAGPEPFLRSNIDGTFYLLEAARELWLSNNAAKTSDLAQHRFHHVSTDEVFGMLGDTGFFDEDTAYNPSSPYSATKAASDHLVRAWGHTYGLNYTVSNCSNNFGPGQHDEKLIPTVIRNALAGNAIPIYGAGENVRDWLAVEDHCVAIQKIFFEAQAGETYCVGGNNEHSNIKLVRMICAILDEVAAGKKPSGGFASLISFVKDRPGHDYRYAIDAKRIAKDLSWQPEQSFAERLRGTIEFYVQKYAGLSTGEAGN